MKYLALLRGINVGGNNIIKKDVLKGCFEAAGCGSVATYIQSGNVLFKSSETATSKIVKKIQKELHKELKNEIQIVVINERRYRKMLSSHPDQWGENEEQKHNALFLLDEMSKKEAKELFPEINPEYETVSFSKGVVFWSGSKENYTKTSYVKNLVKSPLYKRVTIRNAKTSLKLVELFDQLK